MEQRLKNTELDYVPCEGAEMRQLLLRLRFAARINSNKADIRARKKEGQSEKRETIEGERKEESMNERR